MICLREKNGRGLLPATLMLQAQAACHFLGLGLAGRSFRHAFARGGAVLLVRRGELWVAALYAGASVVLGVAAVWVGLKAVSLLPR